MAELIREASPLINGEWVPCTVLTTSPLGCEVQNPATERISDVLQLKAIQL